jgi:hypothetical protein
MSIRRSFLSLFTFMICFVGFARAQNLGSLNGQVTDPNNKAVAGATVHLIETGTQTSRDTKTNDQGLFNFAQVKPGIYTLKFEAPNFKQFVQDKVQVLVATPTTLNVQLTLGAMTEQIVVTAEAQPNINMEDATIGNTVNEKTIKSLPFAARNPVGMLSLQPGVVFSGNSDLDTLSLGSLSGLDMRDGAVNGVRGNQMNISVDGGDANDWQNQAAFTSALPVTLDSIQEFRVTTGGINSTDGVTSGAQVALITKSGTNDFHGNARWYYRTAGPTANSYFNNIIPIQRARLDRNIGGTSIGGRFLKDRIFFFTDWEMRRDAQEVAGGPQEVASDSLRDGVLIYQCAATVDPTHPPLPAQCLGGTVAGLTRNWTVPVGDVGLTPTQIQQIDPAGLGINNKMLAYMALFPHGNSPLQSNDNGLAFNAFDFNAPDHKNTNVYTTRVDINITKDGHHTAFVRGIMGQAYFQLAPEQFPGQTPASVLFNNSKGITAAYNAQFSPNVVNNVQWSLTRLGEAETGNNAGTSFGIRFYAENTAFNRPFNRIVPTNEFKDSVSWIHGRHTFQFGGQLDLVRDQRTDDNLSFPFFTANPGSCNDCGTLQNNLQGPGFLFPKGALPSNANTFNASYLMLTGALTEAHATFFGNLATGAVLPQGTPENRHFAENDIEGYFQDTWKAKPNLSITAGIRYSYASPPWETNGLQVAPTIDAMQWLQQREANANLGIGAQASPLLSWAPAGKANHAASWYHPNYKDFSPRLAIAWGPNFDESILRHIFGAPGKTAVRAGFGIYYDRMGQAIAVDSDLNGSQGLATTKVNNLSLFGLADAPRFNGTCTSTGCTGFPALSNYFAVPTSVSFPSFPTADASNTDFVVDPHLHTPYNMNFSLGIQREIGKGVVLDISYVGNLGRRLMAKVDFAEFANLKDPQSGQTMWNAYQQIAKLAGPGFNSVNSPGIAADPTVPANVAALHGIASQPWFTHMMPNMPTMAAQFFCASGDVACNAAYTALTPTQAFYSFAVQDLSATLGSPSWSCAIFLADLLPGFGFQTPWNNTLDPGNNGFVSFPAQFNGLSGWTNFGSSNYHSLQVGVRKNVGRVTFSANYVFSRSIDNESASENGDLVSGSFNGLLYTPFNLRQGRSVSDFNLTHNFNGEVIYALPFGHGQKWGAGVGKAMNELIGGWEVTSLVRWRSGFPLSPNNGFNFPTDFFLTTPAVLLGKIQTNIMKFSDGSFPNLFGNPASQQKAANNIGATIPGDSGSRNVIIGPSFADVDMDIHKTFAMPWSDHQRLQLRVSAYNLFNHTNFGDGGLSLDPTLSNFGQFTNTIGSPRGGAREMEFGARFEF